ncbi:MAG TPA: hypothetical protein VNJ12_06680 [Candidatus Dormibacteraeota bacterium]|nr:hypothetical protein [Candidatus Dormibacteraeota bacterium]
MKNVEDSGTAGKEQLTADQAASAMAPLLPPGWELVDWKKKGATLVVHARRDDGLETRVEIATLPMACEPHPLAWLRQVLDLKLLWAAS